MKLQPPNAAPERILLYGDAGCGKSTAAMSVSKYLQEGSVMRVIDTDYSSSWHRMMASEQYQGVPVVPTIVGPDDWKGQLAAVREAAAAGEPGDWLVLDSATPTWGALQSLYISMKHGDDFFDFFATQGRMDHEKEDAEMNWQVINAEYGKLYSALFTTRAHLLLTAEADAVGDKDDRKLKNLFQTFGYKPKGQKTLSYTPHTVLLLNKARGGEYTFTTVKDRERVEVERTPLVDLGKDYLMKIAGWRPTRAVTSTVRN